MDPKGTLGAKDAYGAYVAWAEQQGLPQGDRLNSRHFWTRLGSRFPKQHSRGGNVYGGLQLARNLVRVA